MAAKNEERRQGELAKRQQYQFRSTSQIVGRETGVISTNRHNTLLTMYLTLRLKGDVTSVMEMIIWQNFARHLKQRVKEVSPQSRRSHQVPGKWQENPAKTAKRPMNLFLWILSDSDSDDGVKTITVRDEGSASRYAPVLVQGVPAYGIVDTAADITIIGGSLFRKVATVAQFK